MIEVMVRKHDVTHLNVRPLLQVGDPRLDGLLVTETAVDECALASVRHQVDAWRLRAGEEGLRRGDRVYAGRYFHG